MEDGDLEMSDISGESFVPEESTSQTTNFNESANYNPGALDTSALMPTAPFDKSLETRKLKLNEDEDKLYKALKNNANSTF
jgi:hypothetical protein